MPPERFATATAASEDPVRLMRARTAIIIGAGPAGLTAAFELLERSDVKPIVFEASEVVVPFGHCIQSLREAIPDVGRSRILESD